MHRPVVGDRPSDCAIPDSPPESGPVLHCWGEGTGGSQHRVHSRALEADRPGFESAGFQLFDLGQVT